jgi:hypothetical protein
MVIRNLLQRHHVKFHNPLTNVIPHPDEGSRPKSERGLCMTQSGESGLEKSFKEETEGHAPPKMAVRRTAIHGNSLTAKV